MLLLVEGIQCIEGWTCRSRYVYSDIDVHVQGVLQRWTSTSIVTKKRLYPDEEEGAETEPISVAEVEKDVLAMIEADKAAGKTFNYIFDGYKHETVKAFIDFTTSNLGSPSSIVLANCEQKEIEARFKKENEVEEIGEEQAEELKQ